MKNVVKFLSLALVAGTMLVSCGEKYTITAEPNDATMGTVTGGGEYDKDATVTLTATPNAGYVFKQWQDGNTQNPRTITVTADATYTATFESLANAEPSVKVTFGSDIWTAGKNMGFYLADKKMFLLAAFKDANAQEYPYFFMQGTCEKGNYSATFDTTQFSLSDQIVMFDYYKETSLTNSGATYGDWWGESVNMNILAFDANSMKISYTANGKLFSALQAYVSNYEGYTGYTNAERVNFTVNATNIQLELPPTKAFPTNNRKGELHIVK
ncbi:MAG: hypothetical protein SPJ13_03380 [Bacteroidales bacterium]|nr:hypothetical protein [Bacteroidales bacterium]